jgi:hypothetical protein
MVLGTCNRWPARSSYAGVLGLASGWPTALENLTVCAASQDGRASCMTRLFVLLLHHQLIIFCFFLAVPAILCVCNPLSSVQWLAIGLPLGR